VQNAGAAAAGTGLNKSAIIEKISLAEAAEIAASGNASARIDVVTVDAQPTVINPNGQFDYMMTMRSCILIRVTGGTNYRGNLVFTGEGQGDNIAPALYAVNPVSPYNSTGEHIVSAKSQISHTDVLCSAREQLLRQTIHFAQRRCSEPT